MPDGLLKTFPGLGRTNFAVTSSATPHYNCIAWALGDQTRFWWPAPNGYWPAGVERRPTIDAFRQMLAMQGYSECASEALDAEMEKVALFADRSGVPTHAARQLRSGMWTSKLGSQVDIAHELRGLEGKEYGQVLLLFSRPRRGSP